VSKRLSTWITASTSSGSKRWRRASDHDGLREPRDLRIGEPGARLVLRETTAHGFHGRIVRDGLVRERRRENRIGPPTGVTCAREREEDQRGERRDTSAIRRHGHALPSGERPNARIAIQLL
jgi:hypothetical protein